MVGLSNSPYTTNRILEIPQDIKLELNNGTLTLKAGSKVYVPNEFEADGTTPKFDVVTIANDIQATFDNTNQKMCFVNLSSFSIWHCNVATMTASGPTAPSLSYGYWYDTASNIIKFTSNGSTWNTGFSFPICLATGDSGTVTTIDQVFNGFGYIGSTMFALPSVKVQLPNGKDSNGTNLYEIYTNDVVKLQTYTGSVIGRQIALAKTGLAFNVYTYDANENKILDVNNSTYKTDRVVIANVDFESGKVTSWNPYTVDSVANSNASNFSQAGRSYLSGLGMPSNRYIDLTLGATGSSYTAPANGWFCLMKIANDTQHITMLTKGGFFGIRSISANNSSTLVCFCPVIKGDIMTLTYNAAGTTTSFKFYYAEGEN